MSQPICQRCGGLLEPHATDPHLYICPYCRKEYSAAATEENARSLARLFTEEKQAHIRNLRRVLYDAVTAKYVNRQTVADACDALRGYLPEDFAANFYKIAVGNDARALARAVAAIDVDAVLASGNDGVAEGGVDDIGLIIAFLIKTPTAGEECLLALNDLVERAYKSRNLRLFRDYATRVSEFAEQVQDGVYETTLPRDVFVAYSSKDMAYVLELVEVLEEQGLFCFVAARNLRHGYGAEADYDRALGEAMDHCRAVVFVSSMNSRNFACDALRKELEYIQKQDIDGAPAEYRRDYSRIPRTYKKRRVEYRLEESPRKNAADRIVEQFFDGYERVYTAEDVLERLVSLLYGRDEDDDIPAPTPPKPEPSAEELWVLGKQYYDEEKHDEAVPYLRRAAEMGHAEAQCYLGVNYLFGDGVDENPVEGIKWVRMAAEQGLAEAQFALASCYDEGMGVEKNLTEAIKWCRRAAEQGFAPAQCSLGEFYINGEGVDQDLAEAVKWYRMAAEQGDAEAQYYLGSCYVLGTGVDVDPVQGVKWYRLAAEQGDVNAQYILGVFYEDGTGVRQNLTEAIKWYRLAAAQGFEDAEEALERLGATTD